MDYFQALILALVEGITEFLPISSTGHLILAAKLLGIPTTEFSKSFEIIIQLGAILAVAILYVKKVISQPRILVPILIAFLPTGVIGVTFYRFIKDFLLESPLIVITSLALGGLVLIAVDRFYRQPKTPTPLNSLSVGSAILIGLGQSLSIVPGVSRAGATIVSGLFTGLSRKDAVEFSFL